MNGAGGGRPVFYYREHCHLCEDMAAYLFRHWPQVAAGLRWVDVDRDPQLAARFGADVPVLTVGEQTLCRHLPDPEAFTRYFGPPVIPV